MATLCKYEKQQRYASYDDGQTWQPLQEFQVGNLVEFGSEDCSSSSSLFRWVKIDNDFLCVGKDKYTKYVYQVSYDGTYWYNVYPTQYQAGELVESNSEFCDNATEGHYVICEGGDGSFITYAAYIDPVWVTKCDGDATVITESKVKRRNYCLTSITIYDCVIEIGNSAFKGCTSLSSITIPDSVTSIDYSAFQGCQSLTSCTIGSGVTSIGDSAFADCWSLSSITIPNSVTSIGVAAFSGCASIQSIEIPSGVTSIEGNTFRYCQSLSSITIPNSVTSIGAAAFYHCDALTSVDIPSGVTSIGEEAFRYCSGLTSISCLADIPPTLGRYAFRNNDCPIYVPFASLTAYKYVWSDYSTRIYPINPTPTIYKWVATYDGGTTSSAECDSTSAIAENEINLTDLVNVEIGDCVEIIGSHAFHNCTSITSVTISNGVTSIEGSAFGGCSVLSSITIPNNVTSLGTHVFYGCTSLTSITIPSYVTSIGQHAFAYCSGLTSVTCLAITPPALGMSVFYNTNNCPIYVPSASVSAYKSATNWSTYSSRIFAIPNS